MALTPVGAPGAVAAVGVTELDWAETGPSPAEFDACTVNVYACPAVSPEMVVVVGSGEPVTGLTVCAVEPMYGVTL